MKWLWIVSGCIIKAIFKQENACLWSSLWTTSWGASALCHCLRHAGTAPDTAGEAAHWSPTGSQPEAQCYVLHYQTNSATAGEGVLTYWHRCLQLVPWVATGKCLKTDYKCSAFIQCLVLSWLLMERGLYEATAKVILQGSIWCPNRQTWLLVLLCVFFHLVNQFFSASPSVQGWLHHHHLFSDPFHSLKEYFAVTVYF